jgi:hypothetical protein
MRLRSPRGTRVEAAKTSEDPVAIQARFILTGG